MTIYVFFHNNKLNLTSVYIQLGFHNRKSQGMLSADGLPLPTSTSTRTLGRWPMLAAIGTTPWITRVRSIAMPITIRPTRIRTSRLVSSPRLDRTWYRFNNFIKSIFQPSNKRNDCYNIYNNSTKYSGKIFWSVYKANHFQYVIDNISYSIGVNFARYPGE